MSSWIRCSHLIIKHITRLVNEKPVFETVKLKMKHVVSLFETLRLSVLISLRNLYNSLKSINEIAVTVFTMTMLNSYLSGQYNSRFYFFQKSQISQNKNLPISPFI